MELVPELINTYKKLNWKNIKYLKNLSVNFIKYKYT